MDIRKITYTNSNNESMSLRQVFPAMFRSLSGLGSESVTLQTEKGYGQDGVNYYGSLQEPRQIRFDVKLVHKTTAELKALRKQLFDVFAPKLGLGTFEIEQRDGTKYIINASVYDGPTELIGQGNKAENMNSFSIGLYCPNPSYEGFNEIAVKLEGFIGGLEFPFVFPVQFATQGSQMTIAYDGSVYAPLLIEFRGPAENPRIEKVETGEYIELNYNLLEGQALIIDTRPSKIRVEIYDHIGRPYVQGEGTPAFEYVDVDSSFFTLQPGDNTIKFSSTGGSPEVYLYYRDQYTGV